MSEDAPIAPVHPDAVSEAMSLKAPEVVEEIIPLLHHVLLQTIPDKVVTTEAGLHIPQMVLDKQRAESPFKRCKVLAVGDGGLTKDGETMPIPCKVGDTVLIVPSKLILVRDHSIGAPEKEGIKDFICTAGNIVAVVKVKEPSLIVTPGAA